MEIMDEQRLIPDLEADATLLEPHALRRRMDALDALDAVESDDAPAMRDEARALRARLETANEAVYAAIRAEILAGQRPPALLKKLLQDWRGAAQGTPHAGLSFDALDELIAGILALEEPTRAIAPPGPEMVFYQPTPVRHILHFIELAGLTDQDVVVDLGSGLGHVPLLVSLMTGAQCIGVELEPAYVASARACAASLGLTGVTFHAQDARAADLPMGRVFFLYTPFSGSILRDVLRRLSELALQRPIRMGTLGPCTSAVAQESWLEAATDIDPGHVTIFQSKL